VTREPEVALVHDYFVQDGGAEAVALELARMFPDAPVHTTFFERERFGARLDPARVRSWPLQGVLGPSPWFRPLLPAYVAYFSRLRVPASKLLISTSSTFARAATAQAPALHIAYVHAPLRFAWDLDTYLDRSSFPAIAKAGLRAAAPGLRRWDRWAGQRPDVLVANSSFVRRRILAHWHRDSVVVPPPIDVAGFPVSHEHEAFLLVATRLLAYKCVDLAVAACQRLDRELVVIGDGPERRRLEEIAGPRTRFVGHVDRRQFRRLVAQCRAFIAPGIEDFGIAPVEAMAAGKPVIAFARGGCLETVIDGRTGVLFGEPTVGSVIAAIERLEASSIQASAIRSRAMEFDTSAFHSRWRDLLAQAGLEDLISPSPSHAPADAARVLVAAGD
jgi:glycosyltransferase involved in cell wall biosynthesis